MNYFYYISYRNINYFYIRKGNINYLYYNSNRKIDYSYHIFGTEV